FGCQRRLFRFGGGLRCGEGGDAQNKRQRGAGGFHVSSLQASVVAPALVRAASTLVSMHDLSHTEASRRVSTLHARVRTPHNERMTKFVLLCLIATGLCAQDATADLNRQVAELRDLVLKLQTRIDDLEKKSHPVVEAKEPVVSSAAPV